MAVEFLRQMAPHVRECETAAHLAALIAEAEAEKRRADALAATIRALQDVVTHDTETKADFIARVRAVLAADPDARLTQNAIAQATGAAVCARSPAATG